MASEARPGGEMRPVIVIGGGGHARVLIDALRLRGRRILGICDPRLPVGQGLLGIEVLGGDEALARFPASEIELANGVGTTGETTVRDGLYRRFASAGFDFVRIVHPSAVIAGDAELGTGVQVMAGAVIQSGSRIGANSIVNTRASVDHDCRIGESVHLAPGVTLSGVVAIGDGTHVGTGACVIQGIAIGRNCLVRAGAVVTSNIRDGGRVPPRGAEARR